MGLDREGLRRLARLGAVARLEQLRREEGGIRAEFPELFGGARTMRGPRRKGSKAVARKAKRARRPMPAAQRKAVSIRMKKYWAAQRASKAKAGKKTKSGTTKAGTTKAGT
jgi:hypothetical protein